MLTFTVTNSFIILDHEDPGHASPIGMIARLPIKTVISKPEGKEKETFSSGQYKD